MRFICQRVDSRVVPPFREKQLGARFTLTQFTFDGDSGFAGQHGVRALSADRSVLLDNIGAEACSRCRKVARRAVHAGLAQDNSKRRL
jgi:hypothetical protein